MLVDSPQSRSVCNRLQRAQNTLQELVSRHAPMMAITLARLNVAKLQAEHALLPRRQAA